MNNIKNITFIYDMVNDICHIQANNQPIQELAIKGFCKYQGVVNGTWFQIDELTNHWISFRKDKYKANKWKAFYKCIGDEQMTYHRRVFYKAERILAFSFTEKDEWIKVNGKWQSKF